MVFFDVCDDFTDRSRGFDLYEATAVFFDAGESVEILHGVFSRFEHTLAVFVFPEDFSVKFHGVEDFSECRRVDFRKETPRISERMPPDHESVEISVFTRVAVSICGVC